MANQNTITTSEVEQEVWKVIPGFPNYEVSNMGRVRSWLVGVGTKRKDAKLPYILVSKTNVRNGRVRVSVGNGSVRKLESIYRLVLLAFVGPCPEGMEACHNDGDAQNNRLDNLRWDTKENNTLDRVRHGTNGEGSKNGMHKLTEADVVEIRKRYDKGESTVNLAKAYNVYQTNIVKIVNGQKWKHVGGPTHKPGEHKGNRYGKYGEESSNAKLTEKDVLTIRELGKHGFGARRLSRRYHVSSSCIGSILRRSTWKHI